MRLLTDAFLLGLVLTIVPLLLNGDLSHICHAFAYEVSSESFPFVIQRSVRAFVSDIPDLVAMMAYTGWRRARIRLPGMALDHQTDPYELIPVVVY